jgi:hypothetical protein
MFEQDHSSNYPLKNQYIKGIYGGWGSALLTYTMD